MRVQIQFSMSNRCSKSLESIHKVNKQTFHHQSINQSINQNGNSIMWSISSSGSLVNTTLRLKIRDSHLTCKVVNKGLKVREWVEAVECISNGGEYRPLPSPAVL